MRSPRDRLTPQMAHYSFDLEEQPYIQFFQYGNERHRILNTDRDGFRITHGPAGARASVAGERPPGPTRLLVGGSAAFGVGATSDAATLPSRLWTSYAPRLPWLTFAGQGHNSAQELVLFALFRHLLPEVADIVLYSGANTLVLSRLPARQQGRHGAHFERHRAPETLPELTTAERVFRAAELTGRHLGTWKLLAEALDANLIYVLQPLAPWVRRRTAPQEKRIFAELDRISWFWREHSDTSAMETGRSYAAALRDRCTALDVTFLDMNPLLAAETGPDDWLFADRVHCVDAGYDTVARLLAKNLPLL